MLEIIIETLVGSLAENLSGKAFESASKKRPKLFGWLAFVILALIIIGLVILSIVLFSSGVWPIAILMLLIDAFILYITIVPTIRAIRKRKNQRS